MWSVLGSELIWLTVFIGAIVIAILYDKSPKFRYNLKFAVYIFGMSATAVIIIPFAIFRPKDVRNILIGVPFMRPLAKLVGITWKISGKEILAKDYPCVVICNHQSMLDILAITELWPTMYKCACIAKKEVFYVFPFGLMAWLCGTIYINRGDRSQSQTALSTSAEKIKANKTKIWIYPEGTRSKKEDLLPFKKGAFHIALQHKLPIIPVVISPYTFIDDKKKIFDSGVVKVNILNPIETDNLQYPEDVSKLADSCYEIMNLEFQKLKEEVKNSVPTQDKEPVTNGINTKDLSNGHSTSAMSTDGFAENRRSS